MSQINSNDFLINIFLNFIFKFNLNCFHDLYFSQLQQVKNRNRVNWNFNVFYLYIFNFLIYSLLSYIIIKLYNFIINNSYLFLNL